LLRVFTDWVACILGDLTQLVQHLQCVCCSACCSVRCGVCCSVCDHATRVLCDLTQLVQRLQSVCCTACCGVCCSVRYSVCCSVYYHATRVLCDLTQFIYVYSKYKQLCHVDLGRPVLPARCNINLYALDAGACRCVYLRE